MSHPSHFIWDIHSSGYSYKGNPVPIHVNDIVTDCEREVGGRLPPAFLPSLELTKPLLGIPAHIPPLAYNLCCSFGMLKFRLLVLLGFEQKS